MKIRPTWQFWAVLAVGYLLGGWRTLLTFLFIMVLVLLLSTVAALLIPETRGGVVEAGLLDKKHWLIKFFCRCESHTWGTVEIQLPKTPLATSFLKVGSRHERRVGKSYCVGCEKELLLLSFVELDDVNRGKPHWFLMPSDYILKWNSRQSENA